MESISTFLQFSFYTGMVCSVCFAMVLFLIKIPITEYTSRLRVSKSLIAACFAACAINFGFTLMHPEVEQYELFATVMMMVNTALSASALSYSLINLLKENYYSRDVFYLTIGSTSIVSIILVRLMLKGSLTATTIAFIVLICLNVIQCAVHIVLFVSIFKKSRKSLETYYDEDEDHRLKWINFCFWIMMVTELFVLVYLLLPQKYMAVYVLWYCLFMLYFTSNYISFLSTHKIVLDAFAHAALSGEEGKRNPKKSKKQVREEKALSQEGEARENEFSSLERNLDQWVKDKKFREYDKSREQVAAELNTTKELLQLYFAVRKGMDFRTWRTILRIEDSKVLLLEDKMASVQIISETAGFSDRSNFHRQFTKIVGCSPKEWRDTDGHPERLS